MKPNQQPSPRQPHPADPAVIAEVPQPVRDETGAAAPDILRAATAAAMAAGSIATKTPAHVSITAGMRLQIADALTAIMLEAEAARRHSLRPAGPPDVAASSEHIIACARRIWQLVADPREPVAPPR